MITRSASFWALFSNFRKRGRRLVVLGAAVGQLVSQSAFAANEYACAAACPTEHTAAVQYYSEDACDRHGTGTPSLTQSGQIMASACACCNIRLGVYLVLSEQASALAVRAGSYSPTAIIAYAEFTEKPGLPPPKYAPPV